MIGKPEWFTYRKFGWGASPRTKEGYLYIAAFLVILAGVSGAMATGLLGKTAGAMAFGIIIAVLIIDTLHIMSQLGKVHDERENAHQLIVEMNASFAAIGTIMAIIIYQSVRSAIDVQSTEALAALPFDWTLGAILIAMVAAKSLTSYYLKNKG